MSTRIVVAYCELAMDDNQRLPASRDTSDPKSTASDPLITGETRDNTKGQFGPGRKANPSLRPPKIDNRERPRRSTLEEPPYPDPPNRITIFTDAGFSDRMTNRLRNRAACRGEQQPPPWD